jgi:hypothetical protein
VYGAAPDDAHFGIHFVISFLLMAVFRQLPKHYFQSSTFQEKAHRLYVATCFSHKWQLLVICDLKHTLGAALGTAARLPLLYANGASVQWVCDLSLLISLQNCINAGSPPIKHFVKGGAPSLFHRCHTVLTPSNPA